MDGKLWCGALIALAFVAIVPAPAAADEGVRLAPAYLRGSEVCFAPFSAVAWDALARRHFTAFAPDRPPPARIRERWNEIARAAYFEYGAPVPAALGLGFYHVVSEQGVAPVRLTRLRGEIAYASDAVARQIGAPRFSGEACGVASEGATPRDAGFVLFSPARLSPRVRPVAAGDAGVTTRAAGSGPAIASRIEGDTVVYAYREGGRATDFATLRSVEPRLRRAYLLEVPGGRRWLVVRWEPDPECRTGCCEFAYSLYALDPAPAPVLDNRYGCDV